MNKSIERSFPLFLLGVLVVGCTHDLAWVSSKSKNGGRIGYYTSSFTDDSATAARDFKKAATKICGTKKWQVTREIIPPPMAAIGASRAAMQGDAQGTAEASGEALQHDALYRSKILDKKVKVEYGSPLTSWNEAEVACPGK